MSPAGSFSAAVASCRRGSPVSALEGRTAWSRALEELLRGPRHRSDEPVGRWLIAEPPLNSPGETAAATTGQLTEMLESVARGTQKVSVIKGLARWWLQTWGDRCDPPEPCNGEQLRQDLRRIRGLGAETVDRLLLFAFRQPVLPLDRATLRILLRHGWVDIPVEDAEVQTMFRRAVEDVEDEVSALQAVARAWQHVGVTACGRVPLCEGCPLQPYLPAGGPRPLPEE